jgi:hypothetical protein
MLVETTGLRGEWRVDNHVLRKMLWSVKGWLSK